MDQNGDYLPSPKKPKAYLGLRGAGDGLGLAGVRFMMVRSLPSAEMLSRYRA
jgi:hypothetical protein